MLSVMHDKNIFYMEPLSPQNFSGGISKIECLHAKRDHTDTHEKY